MAKPAFLTVFRYNLAAILVEAEVAASVSPYLSEAIGPTPHMQLGLANDDCREASDFGTHLVELAIQAFVFRRGKLGAEIETTEATMEALRETIYANQSVLGDLEYPQFWNLERVEIPRVEQVILSIASVDYVGFVATLSFKANHMHGWEEG